MTLVTMTLAVPTGTVGDPEAPAVGSLEWTPYARRVEDDRVVLPDPFTVTLAASPVTVEVEPGPWRVREMTPAGITRWVVVPDPAPPATIGYEDLPSVNRFTLAPDAVPPEPAWSLALAGVQAGIPAAVADYLTANPPSGSPDATAAVKGILRLTGDLGGTAATPTVPGLAGKAAAVHTHAPADVTGTAVITTDPRLADARTPTAHAASHATGGTDPVTPAAIGAQPAGSYAAAVHTHTASQVSDSTVVGRALLTAADAAAQRTALGLGTAATTAATAYATSAQGTKADTALQPTTAQAINAQTGTTYTLQASDAGKLVTLTNASAITLTVPGATFTAGQRVDCLVLGAGMATVVGSSCTVNGTPSLVSRAQYSAFTVLFTAAGSAVVVGDLA